MLNIDVPVLVPSRIQDSGTYSTSYSTIYVNVLMLFIWKTIMEIYYKQHYFRHLAA